MFKRSLCAIFSVFAFVGCGVNAQLSDEAQMRDVETKMAWVDKVIDVAESHGVAYQVEIEATGRPSIGETVDLYLDTGLSAKVTIFGNSAAGRDPKGAD